MTSRRRALLAMLAAASLAACTGGMDDLEQYVKEVITVNDEEIVAAMRTIWERMKIIVEPSCAVPLAAVMNEKTRFTGKRVGIILSGGTVDLDRAARLFSGNLA